MRVLDACAAPGSKACHVLELTAGLAELVALDINAERATRIASNLARLGLSARVVVGDAARPDYWWDGRPFDRSSFILRATSRPPVRHASLNRPAGHPMVS